MVWLEPSGAPHTFRPWLRGRAAASRLSHVRGRRRKREGGTDSAPHPLGDPGSARVRARAPLAPPIVVQQVELVSLRSHLLEREGGPLQRGLGKRTSPTRFRLACCCSRTWP